MGMFEKQIKKKDTEIDKINNKFMETFTKKQ